MEQNKAWLSTKPVTEDAHHHVGEGLSFQRLEEGFDDLVAWLRSVINVFSDKQGSGHIERRKGPMRGLVGECNPGRQWGQERGWRAFFRLPSQEPDNLPMFCKN